MNKKIIITVIFLSISLIVNKYVWGVESEPNKEVDTSLVTEEIKKNPKPVRINKKIRVINVPDSYAINSDYGDIYKESRLSKELTDILLVSSAFSIIIGLLIIDPNFIPQVKEKMELSQVKQPKGNFYKFISRIL